LNIHGALVCTRAIKRALLRPRQQFSATPRTLGHGQRGMCLKLQRCRPGLSTRDHYMRSHQTRPAKASVAKKFRYPASHRARTFSCFFPSKLLPISLPRHAKNNAPTNYHQPIRPKTLASPRHQGQESYPSIPPPHRRIRLFPNWLSWLSSSLRLPWLPRPPS